MAHIIKYFDTRIDDCPHCIVAKPGYLPGSPLPGDPLEFPTISAALAYIREIRENHPHYAFCVTRKDRAEVLPFKLAK
jgi:hypothetical protein